MHIVQVMQLHTYRLFFICCSAQIVAESALTYRHKEVRGEHNGLLLVDLVHCRIITRAGSNQQVWRHCKQTAETTGMVAHAWLWLCGTLPTRSSRTNSFKEQPKVGQLNS
jgi:hypothetical protein